MDILNSDALRERARPELQHLPDGIEAYDVVFVGYPNWWGTAPMAVFTFLESFDFAGKTVLPLHPRGKRDGPQRA